MSKPRPPPVNLATDFSVHGWTVENLPFNLAQAANGAHRANADTRQTTSAGAWCAQTHTPQPRQRTWPWSRGLQSAINNVRCQTILPTIVAMSAAEKARNDSVRTLPSAPRHGDEIGRAHV